MNESGIKRKRDYGLSLKDILLDGYGMLKVYVCGTSTSNAFDVFGF